MLPCRGCSMVWERTYKPLRVTKREELKLPRLENRHTCDKTPFCVLVNLEQKELARSPCKEKGNLLQINWNSGNLLQFSPYVIKQLQDWELLCTPWKPHKMNLGHCPPASVSFSLWQNKNAGLCLQPPIQHLQHQCFKKKQYKKFYEHEDLKDAVRWYSYWNIHWNIPGYTKLLNIPLVIHKE